MLFCLHLLNSAKQAEEISVAWLCVSVALFVGNFERNPWKVPELWVFLAVQIIRVFPTLHLLGADVAK